MPYYGLPGRVLRLAVRPDMPVNAAERTRPPRSTPKRVSLVLHKPAETGCYRLKEVYLNETAGAGMAGYAESMAEAHRLLRPAFDRWLSWALAIHRNPISNTARWIRTSGRSAHGKNGPRARQ